MKKLLPGVTFALLILCSFTHTTTIEGKWKPALLDAGIVHDYRTGVTTYPDALKESITGSKDSAMTMMMLDMIVHEFDNFTVVYGKDKVYKEYKKGELFREGTWSTDAATNTLTTIVKTKSGREKTQEVKYELKEKELHIIMSGSAGRDIRLVMEPAD